MIKKIKRKLLSNLMKMMKVERIKELEWAHIYHDSIRGRAFLENLPLNVGRWAGNYSFFYVLNRVLSDYKPKNIIEFGLGESTKFISTFLDNYLLESNHTIVEHSEEWKNSFMERFDLSPRSTINILSLVNNRVKEHDSNGYGSIEEVITEKYDLYLVDGPLGSKNYSRYDIIGLAKNFKTDDEFMIIMDDVNRKGEKQTFNELKRVLTEQNIKIHIGFYCGSKDVAIIGTNKYRFITTL